MQSIFDVIRAFLLIVAVGLATYHGIWFYSTLTEKEKKD